MTGWQRPYGADLHQPDKRVEVRYPLTPEQAQGDRSAWPWLPGWVAEVCGPDEWQVVCKLPASGAPRKARSLNRSRGRRDVFPGLFPGFLGDPRACARSSPPRGRSRTGG